MNEGFLLHLPSLVEFVWSHCWQLGAPVGKVAAFQGSSGSPFLSEKPAFSCDPGIMCILWYQNCWNVHPSCLFLLHNGTYFSLLTSQFRIQYFWNLIIFLLRWVAKWDSFWRLDLTMRSTLAWICWSQKSSDKLNKFNKWQFGSNKWSCLVEGSGW